ncbi:MAG: Uma2 family endonuclease [Leptolyngbyaceae cyanobacterium]
MSAPITEALPEVNPAEVSEAIVFPPGDLNSDEPPVETELHLRQILLLIQCLERYWSDRQDFYAFGNLTVYYSPRQRKSEDFLEKHSEPLLQAKSKEAVQSIFGPDFFVVKGAERKPRKSWVVWEEDGRYPNLIVELLSDSTAATDRGLKKQLYQDTFRTPDYFLFDPHTLEFQGFHLVDGTYQDLQPNQQGWLWSEQLQLFLGIDDQQLRFFTPEGQLVLSPEEVAAEVDAERQRSQKLAAKLRELGVDPEEIA